MRKTTRICSLLLFLLVAMWSTATIAAPKLETYLKEQKKLQEKHVERLEELAKWCDDNGLPECAAITRAWGQPHEAPDKIYMSELPKDVRDRIKRPKSTRVAKSKGKNASDDADSDSLTADDDDSDDDSAVSSSKKASKSKAKKSKSKKSKAKKPSQKDTAADGPALGTEEGITLMQYIGDVQLDQTDFDTLVEKKIMTRTGEVLDQEAYDKYLKRKMFGQDEKSDAEDAKLLQQESLGFGLGAGQEVENEKPADAKQPADAKSAAKTGKAAKPADDSLEADSDADSATGAKADSKASTKGKKADADEDDEADEKDDADAIPEEITSDQFTAKQLRELKSKKIVKVDRKTKQVEILNEDAFLKYVKLNKIDLTSGGSGDEDDEAVSKKGSRSKRSSASSRKSWTSSRKSKASKADDDADADAGSVFGDDDEDEGTAKGKKASKSRSKASKSRSSRSSSRGKAKVKDEDEATDADSEADSLFGDDDPEDSGSKKAGSRKSSTGTKSKSRSRKSADEADESLNEHRTGVVLAAVSETVSEAATTLLQIDDPTLTDAQLAELDKKGIIKRMGNDFKVLNQEAFRMYVRRVAAEADGGQPAGGPANAAAGNAAAGDAAGFGTLPSEISSKLFTSKQLRELKNSKVIKVDRKTKLVEVLNEAVFLRYVQLNNIDLNAADADSDDDDEDATAKKSSRSKRSSASSRKSRSGSSSRHSKASKADDDDEDADAGSLFGGHDDDEEASDGKKSSKASARSHSKSRKSRASRSSSRSKSKAGKNADDDEEANSDDEDADADADSDDDADSKKSTSRKAGSKKASSKDSDSDDTVDADSEAESLFGDDDPEDTSSKKARSSSKKDDDSDAKSKSRSRKAAKEADEADESLNERKTNVTFASVPETTVSKMAGADTTVLSVADVTAPDTLTLTQIEGNSVRLTGEMVAEMEFKGIIKHEGNQIQVLDPKAFQEYMDQAAAKSANGNGGEDAAPREGQVALTQEQIDELVSKNIAVMEEGNRMKVLDQKRFQECLQRFAAEKQQKKMANPAASGEADAGNSSDDAGDATDSNSLDELQAIRKKLPTEKQELFDEWLWRFWEIREKAAVAYIKLARNTAKGGFSTLGFEYLMRALQEDPDNAGARKVLGYKKVKNQWLSPFEISMGRKGNKYHEKLGWLPARHIKKYEEGQRFYQGKWISKEEDAKLHANIENGWVIETPHYIVTTNHSIEAGVKIGNDLETLYRVWKQLFLRFFASEQDVNNLLSGRPGIATPTGKHKVYFFRSRQNYMDYLKGRNPNIGISAGLYDTGTKTAYFFAGEDYDVSTMFHEATHQLFTEIRTTNLAAGKVGNFWVIEGIATFMESLHDEGTFHVVGGYDTPRMIAARVRFNREKFYIPLQQFSAMNSDTFQGDPRIGKLYSQAAGLMHFFVFYEGGVYRDALAQILEDTYTFKSSESPATFATIIQNRTGVPFATLDEQYKEFISKNQEELAKWRLGD